MQQPMKTSDMEAELISQGIDPATAQMLVRQRIQQMRLQQGEKDIDRGQGPMGGMVGSGKYQHYVMDPSQLIHRYRSGAAMRDQPGIYEGFDKAAEAYAKMLAGEDTGESQTANALRGSGPGGMQQPNVGQPQQMPPPQMPPQPGGPGMGPPPGGMGGAAQTMPATPPPGFQGTPLGPGGQPMTPQMLEQLKMSNPAAYQAIMSRMGG